MATKTLKAASRDRASKGAARALRRAGNIPAVIYGAKQPPLGIVLERNATSLLLHGGGFLTTVFEIEVDGKVERAIPRDYQLDPVKDTLLHVDFLRVDEHAVIAVEIPVHFVGQEKAPGIKAGGVLNVVRHTVELYVAADAIPDFIEASLEGLEIGDSLHISAIKLPQGAAPTIIERDFTVATIAAPTVDEEPAAEEAAAS